MWLILQILLNGVLLLLIARTIFSSFKNVKIIALLFVGLLSVTLLSIMGIDTGRMVIAYGIIALAIFLIAFYSKNWIYTKENLMGIVLISLFFAIFMISFFYSPAASSEYGIWKIRQFVFLAYIPAFLILLAGKLKEKEMLQIENFIIFTAVATAMVVLVNVISSGQLDAQSEWFDRQSIGEMNPIWLSRFLGLGLLILQIPRFDKKPFMVLSLSLILVVASLLTGSKTVLYFTLPIVIIYRIVSTGLSKRMIFNIAIFSSLAIVLILFFSSINSAAFVNRFSLESGTIGMREIMYQTSFNAYLNSDAVNVIFGNGGATIAASLGFDYVRQYPHNLLIEVLYELGFVGLCLLLLQVIFAVILFIKGKRNWVFFAYILHFLFSLTSGDLATNDLVFTFFALYLVSETSELKRTIKKRKKAIKIVW